MTEITHNETELICRLLDTVIVDLSTEEKDLVDASTGRDRGDSVVMLAAFSLHQLDEIEELRDRLFRTLPRNFFFEPERY